MVHSPDRIGLACDHAGYELKVNVLDFLQARGIQVQDFGTHSAASTDYPDYVHPLARALGASEFPLGIVVCGSGNGVSMTANKHPHIRCALCWNPEIAALARQHNDANVLALPARFISQDLAREIVETFLATPFEGGRHQLRVDKIACS